MSLKPKAWLHQWPGEFPEDDEIYGKEEDCRCDAKHTGGSCVALYALTPEQVAILEGVQKVAGNGGKTGSPPGLLQDDSRALSKALAGKPDSRLHAREAAAAIKSQAIDSITAESMGATDEDLTHAYAEGRKDEREAGAHECFECGKTFGSLQESADHATGWLHHTGTTDTVAKWRAMTDPFEAQGLPPLDPDVILNYSAIRYVNGYPESYVKSYAQAYGDARAAAERERCAKVCEGMKTKPPSNEPDDVERGYNAALRMAAAAIRATTPRREAAMLNDRQLHSLRNLGGYAEEAADDSPKGHPSHAGADAGNRQGCYSPASRDARGVEGREVTGRGGGRGADQ